MAAKLNNTKTKIKVRGKKKKWEVPSIIEVDILRRELMEQFGSGTHCTCTSSMS